MDLTNATFVGLVTIGAVNILTFFKPEIDSRLKVAVAFLVALLVGFVPADLGNFLLQHIKDALGVAVATSGLYKLTQVAGGY